MNQPIRSRQAAGTVPSRDVGEGGRLIVHRTRGRPHGPITRLMSPSDLGRRLKPFVFLDHIDVVRDVPVNFGFHPHSGIATLTVLLEGTFSYEDSTGKTGTMEDGSVEWMQAGRGVWHRGGATAKRIRGYQLWLALPPALETDPPSSLYLPDAQFERRGPARVVLGEWHGARSPIPFGGRVNYLEVNLAPGESWIYDPPPGHHVAWVAVHRGTLYARQPVIAGELAVFEASERPLEFWSEGTTSFMLGSSTAHEHDLVLGDYSVHTSQDRLQAGEVEIRRIGQELRLAGKR